MKNIIENQLFRRQRSIKLGQVQKQNKVEYDDHDGDKFNKVNRILKFIYT